MFSLLHFLFQWQLTNNASLWGFNLIYIPYTLLLIDTHDKLIKIFICTYILKFFFSSNLANPKCKYFRKLVKDVHTQIKCTPFTYIIICLLPFHCYHTVRYCINVSQYILLNKVNLCFNNLLKKCEYKLNRIILTLSLSINASSQVIIINI